MSKSKKYPRTLHLPFSKGTTSGDRFIPAGYVEAFAQFPGLIATEKLDGENTAFTEYGTFSRSHTSPTVHPWAEPVIKRQKLIQNDLKGLGIELFGEGMFGIHSIEYSKLESYFYLFGVRKLDMWLSWEEVKFYAELFDLPTVPVLYEFPKNTMEIFKNLLPVESVGENKFFENYITGILTQPWTDFVQSPGMLGGFDPETGIDACEGLVIRHAGEFKTNNGFLNTYPNEMDAVVKLVRQKHVKTDVHWTKTWRKAKLIDYPKYKWDEYQYLSL